jgi:hypothetical protein
MEHEHVRHRRDQRHRREIFDRIVRQLAVERHVDRVGADRAHQYRVAVGGRFGDVVGADIAAGAGTVIDNHRLAPAFVELLAYRARDDVERTAGGERHDEADRLDGIIRLRERRARRERCMNDQRSQRGATLRMDGNKIHTMHAGDRRMRIVSGSAADVSAL